MGQASSLIKCAKSYEQTVSTSDIKERDIANGWESVDCAGFGKTMAVIIVVEKGLGNGAAVCFKQEVIRITSKETGIVAGTHLSAHGFDLKKQR